MAEQCGFAAFIHRVYHLLHQFGGAVAGCHIDFHRIVQQATGQLANIAGKGRGKQQVLPLGRQQGQHSLDIVDEAHVQHAVGFVQHQDFHLVQFDGVLLVQVEQTARCRHQHIHATAQVLHLRIDADATEHHGGTQRQVFAINLNTFINLCGQLAGRCQYQGAHAIGFDRLTRQQTL